jgi:hypothetical protein
MIPSQALLNCVSASLVAVSRVIHGDQAHSKIINKIQLKILRRISILYALDVQDALFVSLVRRSRVLNMPERAPGLPVIIGTLPIPLELILVDIKPNHSLFTLLTTHNRITDKDHFSILKLACEIQIRTAVIHPGLAPKPAFGIINRKAKTMQIGPEQPCHPRFVRRDSFLCHLRPNAPPIHPTKSQIDFQG